MQMQAAVPDAISELHISTIDPADVQLPSLPVSAATQQRDTDEMVLQHLPMVRFVARRIHERLPQHIELEELVSAGLLGLVDALTKFDGAKQVQFKSYAQFRVRGAILDALRGMDWSPRDLRRKGRAINEAVRSLAAKLGRTPGDAEVAAEMGMPLRDFQEMVADLKGLELGSLNLERGDDAGDEELAFLAAPPSDDPLRRCMDGQLRLQLKAALGTLPEKERLVLTLYYFEELTLREIGFTLGVVESRVSQIRSSALARLRTQMKQQPATSSPANRRKLQ